MPFDKFARYARDEGFCCPLALLVARQEWSTHMLAEDAGIGERAVRFWREDFRKKRLTCQKKPQCALLKALALQTDRKIP